MAVGNYLWVPVTLAFQIIQIEITLHVNSEVVIETNHHVFILSMLSRLTFLKSNQNIIIFKDWTAMTLK